MPGPSVAQRRPERQPRLHHLSGDRVVASGHRSTKAGASTPATRRRPPLLRPSERAQRRPERQPRLHALCTMAMPLAKDEALNEGRSVNPGYTWASSGCKQCHLAAQRRPERQPRLHVEQRRQRISRQMRSTKAGASTPATPSTRSGSSSAAPSLNEGRSVNPGYTSSVRKIRPRCRNAQRRLERQPRLHVVGGASSAGARERSTKAGASTPATPLTIATSAPSVWGAQRRPERQPRLHKDATDWTGADTTAQRRPERQPRLHLRPTRHTAPWHPPLNEGRSVNPGYTGMSSAASSLSIYAQRRPERQPRLHPIMLRSLVRSA